MVYFKNHWTNTRLVCTHLKFLKKILKIDLLATVATWVKWNKRRNQKCKLLIFFYYYYYYFIFYLFIYFLIKNVFESFFKGALDKYNIYLFISSSIENLKSNQYQKFQCILPMRFYFMRYFVNSIIFRVPHRLLYCVFIEVDFEK